MPTIMTMTQPMTRRRKFKLGELCLWRKPIEADEMDTILSYGVIVDYKQYPTGRGTYRVQRVLHPVNGGSYGEAVWVDPQWLVPLRQYKKRHRNVRIYRANQRIEGRDCTCNCCAHVAIPHGAIRSDGTFTWDDPEGDE